MKNKISPFMDIRRLEFVVTYDCTGKCRHCFVDEAKKHGRAPKHIAPQKAAAVLEQLADLSALESVMTFGGEPLLYPDAVCAIHAAATACGVKTRQLITNGYFTKDDAIRRDVARRLEGAGVNNLLLSVDAFHQETIPVEPVYAFARALLDAGVPGIRLHPAWVVDEAHDNSYNAATRQVLSRFADLGLPVSAGNNIFMSGRAVEFLSGHYDKPALDLSETCGARPYTEPLTAIRCLSVEPDGAVKACDFTIGNVHTDAICDIVSRYDPYANDVMRALLTGGAKALVDYAERLGLDVDITRYYSVCDLCRAVSARTNKTAE